MFCEWITKKVFLIRNWWLVGVGDGGLNVKFNDHHGGRQGGLWAMGEFLWLMTWRSVILYRVQ